MTTPAAGPPTGKRLPVMKIASPAPNSTVSTTPLVIKGTHKPKSGYTRSCSWKTNSDSGTLEMIDDAGTTTAKEQGWTATLNKSFAQGTVLTITAKVADSSDSDTQSVQVTTA